MNMESVNDSDGECSLKIDAVWSEADDSLFIKEEIISDVEPDCVPCLEDNFASSSDFQESATTVESEASLAGFTNSQNVPSCQPSKKKLKRSQRREVNELLIKKKLSCLHDSKHFKIVKRRLRCGDCRSLVCPECCKVMIPNLQTHLLGAGVSSAFFCKQCSIIFHSLCALQSHIRIHTMETPYVCPDCGLMYNNMYFLILHVLNKCCHLYKVLRYKCKQCPGNYFTPETFVQHIKEKHIHCVFRCLYCSSLFNSYDEFNFHMEHSHQKQKVQHLNYYRCSLCSNMVIPRFMYQRHVAQHRENSEFYEVNYKCLCGETYSLPGALRSHLMHCDKKGILPPKWSFLQTKMRSQDLTHQECVQNKELVIQTLPVVSIEGDQKKITLGRPEGKVLVNEDAKYRNLEGFMTSNYDAFAEANNLGADKELGKREGNMSGGPSNFCYNCNNNCKIVNSPLNPVNGRDVSQGETYWRESLETEVVVLNEAQSENPTNECIDTNKCNEESQNCKGSKEFEQSAGAILKIYGHIPCDHLGYVIKTQWPEGAKKSQCEEVIVEGSFPPQNYRTVTELDEKTGFLTTRMVPVEELEIEEDDGNLEEIVIEEDCDMESSTVSGAAKQYCGDKAKCKISSTINCPFCVVLFPRQNLTFQQFRLHLESYHPDAALNITISNGENDTLEVKVSHCEAAKKTAGSSKTGSSNLDDEKEFSSKESQTEVGQGKENPTEDDFTGGKKENNFTGGKAEDSLKGGKKEDDFKGGNEEDDFTGGNEEDDFTGANADDHKGTKMASKKETDKILPTTRSEQKLSEEREEGNDQSWESEDCKMEADSTRDRENSLCREFDVDEEAKKNNKEKEEEKIIEDFIDRLGEIVEKYEEARNVEETPDKEIPENSRKRRNSESLDKIYPKTLSDLEYEAETSKDSNSSGLSGKETKSNSPTEEKERSRRESEVWSEFYESLMLAEKLKKKKNPSPKSEGKKKSVVADYSSKRVVKKPKRYRESSESVESNDDSESQEDFLLEDDLMDKICSEERGEAEDSVNKKQILLDKLESVDGKFVDYLFDLVRKKEKFFELYKKHSTLRENRYGHDLRSYRKKVLNGIKQRGRPMKVLRYHDLLKKKELLEEKNNKEKKTELSPENKTNEKKRGRPRKYQDPAKIKERRRSDKEVDFIEKNFEREENDCSPCKRKRKLSSKLQYYKKLSDEKDDFSSGQVISNKPTDSNKKFSCAVCKEVFPEMPKFREHIVAHRMEENTYQCMECGECFVVRPSLEKHLHAFHKIKNTDKYITDNQCCNIKKETPEAEEEPLRENQCKVCKDQFDRPIDLTKHFRIHGMAFLKEFKKEGRQTEKRNISNQ